MSALGSAQPVDRVYVVETIPALQGKGEELRAELTKLVPVCQEEKGCISYKLFQDCANPAIFTVIMCWEHRAAYAAHNEAPHIAVFAKKFRNILYKDAQISENTYRRLV
jgi:quinol monooxygenase YgiN